jgi:hypothetical protein
LEGLGYGLYYGTTIKFASMKNLRRLEVLMAVTVNMYYCLLGCDTMHDIPEEVAASISRVPC